MCACGRARFVTAGAARGGALYPSLGSRLSHTVCIDRERVTQVTRNRVYLAQNYCCNIQRFRGASSHADRGLDRGHGQAAVPPGPALCPAVVGRAPPAACSRPRWTGFSATCAKRHSMWSCWRALGSPLRPAFRTFARPAGSLTSCVQGHMMARSVPFDQACTR